MCVCVGVRACLAVLHCCLQANTDAEEEILLAVVATMAEWRNSREEWFLFNRCVYAAALWCDIEDDSDSIVFHIRVLAQVIQVYLGGLVQ